MRPHTSREIAKITAGAVADRRRNRAQVGEASWPSLVRPWARTNSSTNANTSARLSGGSDKKACTSLKPCASTEGTSLDSIPPVSGGREKYAIPCKAFDAPPLVESLQRVDHEVDQGTRRTGRADAGLR